MNAFVCTCFIVLWDPLLISFFPDRADEQVPAAPEAYPANDVSSACCVHIWCLLWQPVFFNRAEEEVSAIFCNSVFPLCRRGSVSH
jgi:hypothetical protein